VDERLRFLERAFHAGNESVKQQLANEYLRIGKIEEARQLGGLHWFNFRDNHTAGITKSPWDIIWIEAPDEDNAILIFRDHLLWDPLRWSCSEPDCCGTPDFDITKTVTWVDPPAQARRNELVIPYQDRPVIKGSHPPDFASFENWLARIKASRKIFDQPSMRRNPRFFGRVFKAKKLFEERIWGLHELELYPYTLYNDNPFAPTQIEEIDEWLATQQLPPELQQLSFNNVSVIILMSRSYRNIVWHLYDKDTSIILGNGLAERAPDENYTTVTAHIEFQGLRIYPTILRLLYEEIGPIQSSTTLSPGAIKGWQRSGAIFNGARWILN